MRTRILPPAEWAKLKGEHLSRLEDYCDPRNVHAVVVEDDSGDVIACLASLRVTVLEGTWIDPRYRGNPGVIRSLLRSTFEDPRGRGEKWVFCTPDDDVPEMAGYLERLNGEPVRGQWYILPVGV